MGNQQSSPPKSRRSKKKKDPGTAPDIVKSAFGEFTSSIQSGMRKIEDSTLLDTVCGTLMDEKDVRSGRSHSYAYSEDMSLDDSRTLSEDETLDEYDRRRKSKKSAPSDSESLSLEEDTLSEASKKKTSSKRGNRRDSHEDSESFLSEDSSMIDPKKSGKGVVTESTPEVGLSKPLASSFAKRCYFTKAGIGKTTQHYEGLTLTGNVVLMLAAAMKLKGCPTICDEDLRRVEQTYPNQFSRLPDELLLSSGWRRISKYCHFSNKPIPDGVPFFHSKQRIHHSGGYYFLLAAAVGMVRPIEVEPLTRDTLVLLETDYPTQCDAAPDVLIEDPTQWTLVDKFCFFSGGPINTEEDVYYQADFDGNLIFMLAFLSPSLTPEELYKLGPAYQDEPGLKTIAEVEEVESVYDLTERDFDDLKLYHLGPCRALPPYILQPSAWTKVLPPHFLAAKQQAMMKAQDFEQTHDGTSPAGNTSAAASGSVSSSMEAGTTDALPPKATPPQELSPPPSEEDYYPPAAQESAPMPAGDAAYPPLSPGYPSMQRDKSHAVTPQIQAQSYAFESVGSVRQFGPDGSFLREVEEEGAFIDSTVPIDEAIDARRKKRGPRPPHSEGSRGPGSLMGSEAETSYTGGSSYVEQAPTDEPPSLSMQDAPDDEGGFQDEYTDPGPHTHYGQDEEPYDASEDDVRSPANGAPNGYYDEYYKSDSRETGGSPEYYEREEEYYDSPEKGNLRVHTALEQHAEFGKSPEPGSHPGFIYSQESGSEFSAGGQGYHHDDGGHDESQGESHMSDPVYSPAEVESHFDSLEGNVNRRAGDDGYSSPAYADSKENKRTAPPEEENYSEPAPQPAAKTPQEKYLLARSGFRSTRPTNMISPRSDYSIGETSTSMSEYSQTSAMRGAQELLKKNRQRRLELAMRKHKGGTAPISNRGDEFTSPRKNMSAVDDDASATTSSLVSGSSVWTDPSGADRTSRRALILQMAKARMKSNKTGATSESNFSAPIAEESSVASGDHHSDYQSKTTAPTKVSEMDLAGELD